MAKLFYIPKIIAFDTNGEVISAAQLRFHIKGTTTLQNVFTDEGLGTPLVNPVIADGNGVFPPIFLDPSLDYKATLENAAGVPLSGYAVNDIASKENASDVQVLDTASNYVGSDLETILAEIAKTVGSFTPTYGGFSADPTGTVFWALTGTNNNIVTLRLAFGTGTSNAATFSITNLPSNLQPVTAQSVPIIGLHDNTADLTPVSIAYVIAGATLSFGLDGSNPTGGGWTGSGTKGVQSIGSPTFQYTLDTLA